MANGMVAKLSKNPLVQGAVVGYCASQALDQLGIFLYENESRATREAEDRARGGRHVYEVAVSQLAEKFGRKLTRREEQEYGWRFHQVFGLLTGVGYVAARKRFSWLGLGRGVLAGTLFFLIVDELMMPLMRWSPGPRAFDWKVHGRGAVTHLAYGIAAESAYRALERASL